MVETALGAGEIKFGVIVEEKDGRVLRILAREDVEFGAIVEEEDGEVLSEGVVWLLKLRLRGEFVLASVLF